tara:strand:+ start:430 stop:1098 length:669 start_codon:yes stop_codon:yes gene_type:complete
MGKYKVAFIIPAYNESLTIQKVIKSINKFGKAIVIDDASTDSTGTIAKKSGALVIKNKINMEYDFCIGKGISYAVKNKFDFAITFDADGQHLATDIPKIITTLKDGYDLVLGIRNKVSRVTEKLSIKILDFFFKIKDPYCGLKGYRLSKIKKKNLITYKSTGTEIAFYMINKGCRYKNLKVSTLSRKDNSRFGNKISANYKILKSTILTIQNFVLKRNYENN